MYLRRSTAESVTGDAAMFHAIGQRLDPRPGWGLEPSTTPGGDPSWCFEQRGRVVLSVGVTDGVISAFVPDHDAEVQFTDVDALLAWISLEGWTRLDR